ncbi:hypothetical protein K491DRAFT_708249 [Lophiostoma macrostomum CBS 122681]|uniref:Pyoverdine/dityrosine biosynthesis protein n=1 Tax=Lophiostoma macrostomum CBS 122681 TaxID=1314788 RepID=A0A6A6SRX3_9PLEO|nr:hypothetical protein K491DRAFT_708249 [Lophiostoma macrostomum CBS 122681]
MPPLNKGTSTYHVIQGLYWRDSEGRLLAAEGSNSHTLYEMWPLLCAEIRSNKGLMDRVELPSGRHINTLRITAYIPALENIRLSFPPGRQHEELITRVAEIKGLDGLILGVLTSRPKSLAGDRFDTWAEHFILLETQFEPFAPLSLSSHPEHRKVSEQVAGLFEKKLKNASRDDQWKACGRPNFINRVYGYVQKSQPILLCLPAFPCKSPNPNKVGGTMPDLAEYIALDVLHDFVKDICKLYPPGATLWIISDGHVFSDCIGVDDSKVDAYDARLIEFYTEKHPAEEGTVSALQFKGLRDIFMSNSDSFDSFQKSWLTSAEVLHPVETARTDASELCRKLLLGVSQADRGFIRKCIEEQEPHALQLYRGQTRFMLEDLTMLPSVIRLSNKQKKKTAAMVAQEMISRNQAYSNLVELLLPNYVRLSIHAHDNAGPKFAVRLLPKSMVRPIESLEDRHEPISTCEFQIPTPWHNSIIKVEGDELMYLARAEVAKKAVEGPAFEGSWVDSPAGGFFGIKRQTMVLEEKASIVIATAPLPAMMAEFTATIRKDQLMVLVQGGMCP